MVTDMISNMQGNESHVQYLLGCDGRSVEKFNAMEHEQIFTRDGSKRFYLKKLAVKEYINIFPWFNVSYSSHTHKFREPLKDFCFSEFRGAIQYFCRKFELSEIHKILICYRQMYTYALKRPLSAVIKVYHMIINKLSSVCMHMLDYWDEAEGSSSDTGSTSSSSVSCSYMPCAMQRDSDCGTDDNISFDHTSSFGGDNCSMSNCFHETGSDFLCPSQFPFSSLDNMDFQYPDMANCALDGLDILDPSLSHRQQVDSFIVRIDHMDDRMLTLHNKSQPPVFDDHTCQKRPRFSGDRAGWMRIKARFVRSRDLWCRPGAVMGIFTDEVAPITSTSRTDKITGLTVYADPTDVTEAHPDPDHPDLYAPYVMVGHVPVALRNEAECWKYLTMQNQEANVVIDMTNGDVQVLKATAPIPAGCELVGRAPSGQSAIDDSNLPTFQGIRGICTVFNSGLCSQYMHIIYGSDP